MEYIKGKFKSTIYENTSNGYTVGLFRVSEVSDNLRDSIAVPSTISFTGFFTGLNSDDNYIFYGDYIKHERFGYQFKVDNYEKLEPTGEDQVIDFLTSSFVKGCGPKTAEKIVKALGENALELIKEDKAGFLG